MIVYNIKSTDLRGIEYFIDIKPQRTTANVSVSLNKEYESMFQFYTNLIYMVIQCCIYSPQQGD